jgi:hypothetical protein
MAPSHASAAAECFAAARSMFNCVVGQLADPSAASWTHDHLEDILTDQGRELLRLLFQAYLDLLAFREEQAVADVRRARGGVAGGDGIFRRRVETGHQRLLATVFGTVTVTRCAWRAPGAGNVHPADAALSLPVGRHSHGLARLAVAEAVRGSFDTARTAITARCGKVAGKRQLEQLVQWAAADIDAFYAQMTPVPRTAEELLVLSVDGKGIAMIPRALRPAAQKAAARRTTVFRTRLASGEKNCRKRMATLGVVYDAAPAPRRPHDVIAVPGGRHGRRQPRPGPRAIGKWLHGSVIRDPGQVVTEVFGQAEARDPAHIRTWVVLVDGARHQLELIQAEAARRKVPIHIVIDLVHVLEYLWKAAWCLHAPGDSAAEDWVATHALALLAGHAGQVTTAVGVQAAAAGLDADHRAGIDACIRYISNNIHHLCYDQALEKGWPISTGVIEGAARHLIADRFDLAGARWGLAGAEALLKLRALTTNGDLGTYWRFHTTQEHHRHYQDGYALIA